MARMIKTTELCGRKVLGRSNRYGDIYPDTFVFQAIASEKAANLAKSGLKASVIKGGRPGYPAYYVAID